MADTLDFFAEVRVIASSKRPELVGAVGAVLGITEPKDPGIAPSYSVMLDELEETYQFQRDQLEPTGRTREYEDYY